MVNKMASKKTPQRKKPLKITASNRAKVDPATGRVISRRQFDKKYGRKLRISAGYFPRAYKNKLKLYMLVRNDYIEKHYQDTGKRLGKREAMNSPELKRIIRDLKSSDPIKKALALERTGRITPDKVEQYAQKFSEEGDA